MRFVVGGLVVLTVFAGLGCYQSYAEQTDGDQDAEPPWGDARLDVPDGETTPDIGSDVDADADADAEADAGADTDSDACAGGWRDPVTGLCWQEPAASEAMSSENASRYCDALELGGFGPGVWRLPTIGELRSLVRGCPATETGGECGVTDDCLRYACGMGDCAGCPEGEGPGPDGLYWPGGLRWTLDPGYWSSSVQPPDGAAWYIEFHLGIIISADRDRSDGVRCVRSDP
jgi:hypothetical protein